MILAACGQKANCSGISFGGSTSGGGSSSGGVSTGGTVCGGGTNGTGAPVSDFVYYMQGNSLLGASLSGNTLAPISGFTSPALGLGDAADMTVVNKKFVYEPWVPSGGVVAIQGFAIDRNSGALTPVPGNPAAPATTSVDSIISDPMGRFLYVGDRGTAQISVFQVDATTGALTLSQNSPFATAGSTFSMLSVDGTGKYLYAADSQGILGFVYGFNIDQFSGELTPIPGSPFNLDLFFVQADATGKFLFGIDSTGNINVLPLQVGTGIPQPGTTLAPTSHPYALAVHPNGNFVYSFALDNQIHPKAVEGFQVDGTGNLTALTGSPFTTLPGLFGGKFDQDGTGLFALNTGGGVQVFVVDPATGGLTANVPPISTVASYFAPTN